MDVGASGKAIQINHQRLYKDNLFYRKSIKGMVRTRTRRVRRRRRKSYNRKRKTIAPFQLGGSVPKGGIQSFRRQRGGNFFKDIWNATLGQLFK